MNSWVNLHALWRIVVIGVVAGAGLPALFAVGLRALALPASGRADAADRPGADSSTVVGGNPLGIAAAAVCFTVVVGALAWGVYLIVKGT